MKDSERHITEIVKELTFSSAFDFGRWLAQQYMIQNQPEVQPKTAY